MKIIFSIPLRFLLIIMAIILTLGCEKESSQEPSLSNKNALISCSVEVGGKKYDVAISSSEATGTLSLPYDSDLSTMKVATIKVSDKAKTSLSDGSSITVSDKAFTIDVTAEDGSVNNHTITIVIGPASTEAKILSFQFKKANNTQLTTDVVVTIANNDMIKVALPYSTNPNLTLTANFKVSKGASIKVNNVHQSSGISKQDFSSAIRYVVTSQDRTTTKTYVVIVSITPPYIEAKITAFKFESSKNVFLSEDVVATIAPNDTIRATIFYGSTKLNLIPTFTTSKGATIKVNNVHQSSGISKQNFSSAIRYVVTSQDRTTTKTYIVIVSIIPPNTEAKITTFKFESSKNVFLSEDVVATIATNDTIRATIPYGVPDLNLIPTFTTSTGATVIVNNVEQSRGTSKQDFSSPVSYVITAQHSRTIKKMNVVKTYVVMVNIAGAESKITAFSFEKANNPRLPNDVMINLTAKPTQADVGYIGHTIFVPTFSVSYGAKVYVDNKEQKSGYTPQDFLNTVEYKIVSQSGDTQTYKIAINYTSTGFSVTNEGAISGNNTPLTTAVIGEYMNGIRVTEIATRGFSNKHRVASTGGLDNGYFSSMKKLRLPISLEKIGDQAFRNCYGLKGSLTIPSNVKYIGKEAFHYCYGLTGSLTIPSNVQYIGKEAFSFCHNFSGTLTIPSSVLFIGEHAFSGCDKFKIVCNKSPFKSTNHLFFWSVSPTFNCP